MSDSECRLEGCRKTLLVCKVFESISLSHDYNDLFNGALFSQSGIKGYNANKENSITIAFMWRCVAQSKSGKVSLATMTEQVKNFDKFKTEIKKVKTYLSSNSAADALNEPEVIAILDDMWNVIDN